MCFRKTKIKRASLFIGFILFVITVLFLVILTLYKSLSINNTRTSIALSNSPTSNISLQNNLKTLSVLLQSKNITDVIKGMMMLNTSDLTRSSYYKKYSLPFFKIDLTEVNYNTLYNYLGFTEFPNFDNFTYSNETFKAYSYSSNTDIYTKNNFGCLLTSKFPFPPNTVKSFKCAKIGNIQNNTQKEVTTFILETLSEAGINCNQNMCSIVPIDGEIPLPMYSLATYGFNKETLKKNNKIKKINEDIIFIEESLKKNSWNISTSDYTKTEKTWNDKVYLSKQITAKNNYFDCVYTISGDVATIKHSIECAYSLKALINYQKEINRLLFLQ